MSEKELNEDFEEVLREEGLFEDVLGDRALILNEDPVNDRGGVRKEENEDRVEMNNEATHEELADKYL